MEYFWFQEKSGKRVPNNLQYRKVAEEIQSIYLNAHSSFSLIDINSVTIKIRKWYQMLLYHQRSAFQSPSRQKFDTNLQNLFEILKCRCKMLKDGELVRVNCTCPSDQRIPAIELDFIYAQRNRGGTLPTLKIGALDAPTSKRLQISASRKVCCKM